MKLFFVYIVLLFTLLICIIDGQDARNTKEQLEDTKRVNDLKDDDIRGEKSSSKLNVIKPIGMTGMRSMAEIPPIQHTIFGAPHALKSWKTPIDYMIDSNPKKTDNKGGNIVDPTAERNNFLPTTNKELLHMFQGVRVLLDRPAHVLSELDLRKIGIAVNDVFPKPIAR